MTRSSLARVTGMVVLALTSAGASVAQDTLRVALSQPTYDVFELTTATPLHVLTLPLGPARTLTIDVTSKSSEVNVEILTPLGTPIDQDLYERFAVEPGQIPPLGAVLFEEGFHVQAEVTSPVAGAWTVRVALPAGATTALGNISAFITGGLSIGLTTSRHFYQANDTVVLALLAFREGLPAAGMLATASVYTAGTEATPTVVTLLDDGQNGDAAAGDGLYSASVAGLAPGHYMVSAVAQMGDERATAATNFDVTQPLARLAGTKSDSGLDTNADGLFEWINVEVGVTVDSAGPYLVFASLSSPATSEEITAAASSTLAVGLQSVQVPFGAATIRDVLGINGPWEVRDVRLVPVTENGVPSGVTLDKITNLGPTSAYLLAQLQRPITQVLPGLTEHGIDTNANGLFDLLQATFQVDTLRAGSYTWTGTLRSPDGNAVSVSSGQGTLAAGVATLGFTFDGEPIGASGLDGPYGLFDVAIYGPPGAAALAGELGSTRPYTASQFEGSQITLERLIELVETVPLFGRGGVPFVGGIRNSLLQKLRNAQSQAAAGSVESASGTLGAFINEVQALADERIMSDDRDRLVEFTNRLLAKLANP